MLKKISKMCLICSLSLFSTHTQAAELNLQSNANCVTMGQQIEISYQSDQNGYISLWNHGASSGQIIRLIAEPIYAYQKQQVTLTVMGPVGIDDFYLLWTPEQRSQPRWTQYPHEADFQRAISGIQQTKMSIRTASDNCQISAPKQTGKNMVIVPTNNSLNVNLDLTVNPITVKVGENVKITFESDQSGYVTLWDIGTSGKVARFFPAPHENMHIKANTKYRIGPFQVGQPLGMEDIYLLWTKNANEQPQKTQYQQAMGLSKDVQAQQINQNAWETAKVTFEIVDPNAFPHHEPPTRIAPWRRQTEIYILAMGANVIPLTKTNKDAKLFAETVQTLFDVPDSNVKLIENAYKEDFKKGMAWLKNKARPESTVFIFFSGHGDLTKDKNNDESDGLDEAFVMMNASETLFPPESYLILDEQFAQWVNNLNTEKVITVIDACHSGGLNKGYGVTNAREKLFAGGDPRRLIPAPLPKNNYYLYKDKPGGLDKTKGLILAAAKESEKALEVQEGGLFVTTLIQEWTNGQERNLLAVFKKVREKVNAISDGSQTPTLVGNQIIARELSR